MIGYIHGSILSSGEGLVLILTSSGVAYDILVGENIYARAQMGEEKSLYIYHHINEANQVLYGFDTLGEKQIFTQLLKISGVGGKVGLQLLSLGQNTLIAAVMQDDQKVIESVKGIGKKMAEKIIIELRDNAYLKSLGFSGETEDTQQHIQLSLNRPEIFQTLRDMGYSPERIQDAYQSLPEDTADTPEALLGGIIRNIH